MFSNRRNYQPDFLFMVLKVPHDWRPNEICDIPPEFEVISSDPVASFDEACDDLVRCNVIAKEYDLAQWAVIQTARAEI